MTDPKALADRFFSKVLMGTSEQCWLWLGGLNTKGYGQFRRDNRSQAAHRWSYEYYVGPIPEGLFVLHHCDVRNCVNPAHLFAGTHQDNMDDMTTKDRQAKGERMGSAKLTDDDVREIRASRDPVMTLSRRYGVTYKAVRDVVVGTSWGHVT